MARKPRKPKTPTGPVERLLREDLDLEEVEILMLKAAILVDMHGMLAFPFLEWAEKRYRNGMLAVDAEERILKLLRYGDATVKPSVRYAVTPPKGEG